MTDTEMIIDLQRRLSALEIQFALREVREVRPDLSDAHVLEQWRASGSDDFTGWVAAQRTAGNGVFEYTPEQIRSIPLAEWDQHRSAILAQIMRRRNAVRINDAG